MIGSSPKIARYVFPLALLCTMSACDGCPPSGGGGTAPPAPQARALFQNYQFDTFPQTERDRRPE